MVARRINARWCASTFGARWSTHSIHDLMEPDDMAAGHTTSTAKVVEPPSETKSKGPGSGQVQRSVRRLESKAKVDGSAEYIHNLSLPGMLYGKIARSSIPHGKILSIDATAALAVEGVHAVITGEDIRRLIPDPYYGPAFHDQPILALDVVRYVGEAVAVVLAATHEIAREAKDLVAVDYEPLPAVFDECEAAKPEAPLVHE